MAYILSKVGQSFNVPIRIYEADTEEDMNTIDIQDIPMGSKCHVINNGKWYMLNSERKWKAMPSGSGSGNPGGIQPDWNQNDETAADYVKNRPFYTEESNINITWDGNTTGLTASSENHYYKVSDLVLTLEEFEGLTFTDNSGSEYLIGYDFIINGNNVLSYGDSGPVIATIDNAGGIPGAATDIFPEAGVYFPAAGSVVSLQGTADRIVKLDNKFLDLSDYPKRIDLSYKMDKLNPNGAGSFSLNREPNSTVGLLSFAEGGGTTASGDYSHAEGNGTTASGSNSHAEGGGTTASGDYSHAEGNGTTASGINSHAEGSDCIAQGLSQHVQGKYNIASGTSNWIARSDYCHIVGNGKSDSERSNAHTLTWSGIPWYQGRPQFGGTSMDNGSQTVMANGDKEIILVSSTANSTKKFKITVDDSGTITATEVV